MRRCFEPMVEKSSNSILTHDETSLIESTVHVSRPAAFFFQDITPVDRGWPRPDCRFLPQGQSHPPFSDKQELEEADGCDASH